MFVALRVPNKSGYRGSAEKSCKKNKPGGLKNADVSIFLDLFRQEYRCNFSWCILNMVLQILKLFRNMSFDFIGDKIS